MVKSGKSDPAERILKNIMSIDFKRALGYAILAQEINVTFGKELAFREFPGISPELFWDDATDTQAAAITVEDNHLLLVFRGTEGINDWKTNVQFSRKLFEISGPTALGSSALPKDGPTPLEHIRPVNPKQDLSSVAPRARMHEGFTEAYIAIQDGLHKFVLFQDRPKLTLIGHSLGGALATLCAVDFQLSYANRFEVELFTFGSPRVGNPEFRELVNEHIPRSYRFVNGLDAVPGLPPRWNGYRHIDQVSHIGRWLTWRIFSARIKDHFMDGYIGALREKIGSG